jgi:hypothetical protein
MSAMRPLALAAAGLLTALLCCASPAASRAGTLDRALLGNEMASIIAEIDRLGYDAVGVLPFRVKRGSRPASFTGAPLCQDLPRRIENALIVSMKVESFAEPIGVTRDAAGTAARGKVGSYTRDKAAFDKLFQLHYPLAWGDAKVKADAFLHGTVYSVGSREQAVVEVQLFDAKCWRGRGIVPKRTWRISARADRPLLADLGYGFSLARGAFDGSASTKELDDAARKQAAAEDGGKRPQAVPGHAPDDIGGFAYELCYNGKKQALKPLTGGKGAGQPQFEAPPAPAGAAITMRLTRKDGDPVLKGVVLLVNGKSTYEEQTGDPLALRRWTFGPETRGVRETWEGFHRGEKGEKVHRFKSLTPEESLAKAAEFGTHAGWIHIHVLVSRKANAKATAAPQLVPPGEKEEYEAPKLFSMRSLPSGRQKSFDAVRKELMRLNHLREKKGKQKPRFARQDGGLIVPEVEAVAGAAHDQVNFPNPELTASLAIRYYAPGGKKLEAKGAEE